MSSSDKGLTAWLRQQIEARKAAAEAASEGPWDVSAVTPAWAGFKDDPMSPAKVTCIDDASDHCLFVALRFGQPPEVDEANAAHVAANDPQDTIARCEAELAILDEHACVPDYPPESIAEHRARGWPEDRLKAMAEMVYCDRCHTPVDDAREDESQCLGVIYPCRTVRLLASGYRHRPGYREEWAPTPR
jgi:hypothetical protein